MISMSGAARRVDLATIARWAMAPARLIGKVDTRLAGTAQDDFARVGHLRLFVPIVAFAVLYPIVAAIGHAFAAPVFGGDPTLTGLRPTFDVVYTESLVFVVAGLAVGLFAPSLGVLWMAVFIPTDLLAASYSRELANAGWQVPFSATVARLASYALLWLLIVEVPIRAGRVAAAVGAGVGTSPRLPTAVAYGLIAALMGFFWASAAGFLIAPVFTWTELQLQTVQSTDPTWFLWPLLVGAAAIVAGAVGVACGVPYGAASNDDPDGASSPPSARATVIRQAVAAILLALLAGAFMTGPVEAIIVIGGFMVAGPVLTVVLSAVTLPRFLGAERGARRWVAAGIIAAALSLGLSLFAWDLLAIKSDAGFALSAMIVIVAFRIALDAGQPAPWQRGSETSTTVA